MKKIILNNPRKKMNIHLDEELADEIKEEAKENKTSMGKIIEDRLLKLKEFLLHTVKS